LTNLGRPLYTKNIILPGNEHVRQKEKTMNSLKLCLVLCLIVTLPITAPSVQQKPYPVVTEVKDGVKTITNPDFPRDGRFIAKLKEEMSCGGEGSPEAALLNKPLQLNVDAQGNVYVMDYGDVNIKVYDGQGTFLRAIGRQGQGPGEFGGMVFFNLMSGNRICVLDFMQNRVILLSTDGRLVSGFPLKEFLATLAVDGRDRIFLGKHAAVKEIDKLSTDFQEVPYVTSIFRTDAAGKELTHLTDFLGESLVMKAWGGAAVSVGGLYAIFWTVGPDGRLYGGYNLDYSVGVFGEDGKKEFAFGREFAPVKNPRFKGTIGQKKSMPAFRNIVIGEDKNLWVELYQIADAKGFLYDVFSPDGIYSKQVSIEQRIGVFKNGKVYSLLRPEEGYASIKRYSMELVPSGK
jgi:hypothetical protein